MIQVSKEELELHTLKQKIIAKVRHPFLTKFIPEPVIDEDKLVLLASIMDDTNLPDVKKEQYIITTMLVQVALDTHDLVTLTDEDEEQETVRNRQLTVLAGDYYSGMYYYLLSQLDDIPMIHTLASAIKDINEQKMELYYKDVDSFQEFMNGLRDIESLLIQRVASYVQRAGINDVAGEWLLTKKLLDEKKNIQQNGFSPLFDLLLKSPTTNTNYAQIMTTVENMIQKNINRLELTLSQLPLHFNLLKSYVHTTLSDHQYTKQFAEEG